MELLSLLLVLAPTLICRVVEQQLEVLALRRQIAMLLEAGAKPKITDSDRRFFVWLSRIWPAWKSALFVVRPETVIRWHKEAFTRFWAWKSRKKAVGRPPISAELRELIRRMSIENPTCGAPRIHAELALVGHEVAKSTVARYMARGSDRPTQT